jgi:hypothetical protein
VDDGIVKLAAEWRIVPDPAKPLPELSSTSPAPRSGVAAASNSPAPKEASTPAIGANSSDSFQAGSVWTGKAGGRRGGGDATRSITVLQRNGNSFKAKFEGPARSGIIHGKIQDGKISYTFEEVDRGKAAASEISATITGDKITFANAGPPMTLAPKK